MFGIVSGFVERRWAVLFFGVVAGLFATTFFIASAASASASASAVHASGVYSSGVSWEVAQALRVDVPPPPLPAVEDAGSGVEVVSSNVSAPAGPHVWQINVTQVGGQDAVDACDGNFVRFTPTEGYIIPGAAAHNSCGGDVVLQMAFGDQVQISGGGLDGLYEVVDERDPPQGGSTDDVAGITGDVYLQTCFWSNGQMRFLGLARIR